MKKVRWVPATAGAAMIAATLALPGAGVAYASGNGNVTGDDNIPVLSGNTITAPISAPVNLCGIAVAVAGVSDAGCQGGSTSTISQGGHGGIGGTGSHNGNVTGVGNIPVGSGNTVTAPVSVPVNVCGVSGAVAGLAHSDCQGGSTSTISQDGHGGHGRSGGTGSHNGNVTGVGNIPVLSGNTITAPVSAPVNVCGIAVGVLGFSGAGCQGGSTSCIGSNCNTPCTHCHTRQPCLDNDCHTRPPCHSNCHTPRRARVTTATCPRRAWLSTATCPRRARLSTATPPRRAPATATPPRRATARRTPRPAPGRAPAPVASPPRCPPQPCRAAACRPQALTCCCWASRRSAPSAQARARSPSPGAAGTARPRNTRLNRMTCAASPGRGEAAHARNPRLEAALPDATATELPIG